jgi:hypothetical protein
MTGAKLLGDVDFIFDDNYGQDDAADDSESLRRHRRWLQLRGAHHLAAGLGRVHDIRGPS